MTSHLTGTALTIEREFRAAIEDVFDAWTNPARMAEWMSPVGHAEATVDLAVDGRFRVTMINGQTRIEHTGTYLVVDPPNDLSFTWHSPYTGSEPSVVTVSLVARGTATRMVLTHRRLPEDQVGPHSQGWGSMLDRLDSHLGGISHRDPE